MFPSRVPQVLVVVPVCAVGGRAPPFPRSSAAAAPGRARDARYAEHPCPVQRSLPGSRTAARHFRPDRRIRLQQHRLPRLRHRRVPSSPTTSPTAAATGAHLQYRRKSRTS